MSRFLYKLNVARLALFPLGLAPVLVSGTLNRVMIVELGLPASLVGLFFAMTLGALAQDVLLEPYGALVLDI